MYITIKKEDTVKYDKLKLCYVDEIPTTYHDYTPEARAYRETDEWKEQNRLRDEKLHRQGYLSYDDPEFGYTTNSILNKGAQYQYYPNPDYIEGKQEYYAFFTPAELDKQWGDDWNDRPYEYNAEMPYDDYYEGDTKVELNIIKVPFWVPYDGGWEIRFPRDWTHDNSPFSVQDINAGAVAWVFDSRTRTTIYAGCNPEEFLEKIGQIIEARKEDKDV